MSQTKSRKKKRPSILQSLRTSIRQSVHNAILPWLKASVKTWHGRLVLAGLTVGLCYLPAWLPGLITRAAQGSAGLPLLSVMVFLGLQQLWKRRDQLAQMHASEEDQFLGHLLIGCSVLLFPFCRFAIWPQSILWLLALAGIACSTWGVSFFWRYPVAVGMLALTAYPKPGVMARLVWTALTPPEFLERIMAQAGATALRVIGHPAIADGTVVALPQGAVDVDWGCNGFNMAFTMAAAGLIMGLFLKQTWPKVLGMMAIGAVLALIFNVPRIMLLTIASVYWGDAAFKFWHGHWGGQLFSSVLFTFYYYAARALANRRRPA
ncbi:cyanoexosortase C [Thermoleptolyngbya sichuanensis A183]|uniref:Cyanoexosortase C n=1 Tax=Thermoleptolyngbya sichuanensis A183 TaxID=2737172 RepID=A0A6M8B659_9CYAN|nr:MULTISPECIES: cyanoexosortase C [Thermoleptolyngbya]QKD81612.1 cyanoexosortase C [Thermoleptolyngbya sichuanensis A183]